MTKQIRRMKKGNQETKTKRKMKSRMKMITKKKVRNK